MGDAVQGLVGYIMKGIREHDFDCVLLIDGPEGVGKSTVGMHLKAFADGKYNLVYLCYDSRDLLEIMQTAPKCATIILDEAVTAFMSRTSLDRFQVRLVQAFSIVREKNLFFILIIPNINLLDKALVIRSRFRIWVFAKGHERGFATIYYASRNAWSKTKPWWEEAFRWTFPELPERTKSRYKEFKSKELDRKLKEYQDEERLEDEQKAAKAREIRGAKTRLIIDYLDAHPKATDAEIARHAGCSMEWVKKAAAPYRS